MLYYNVISFFFFKQKTAYEITASDWSSDVCSSDLHPSAVHARAVAMVTGFGLASMIVRRHARMRESTGMPAASANRRESDRDVPCASRPNAPRPPDASVNRTSDCRASVDSGG